MHEMLLHDDSVLALFGEGKRPAVGFVRGSRFNYFSEDKTNGVLVFNTLTNTLFRVDAETAGALGNGVKTDIGAWRPESEELFRRRLLVADGFDELAFYRDCHALLLQLRNLRKGIVRYNIYTTTACNARCFYCFEAGIRQESMSAADAGAVADYVSRTHSPTGEIYLRWFGGEPLLNPEAIDIICARCRDEKVDWFSTISTNGLLLDAAMLRRGLDLWNLDKVRFSFDGMDEEHNRRKRAFRCRDAFGRTMENLRRAADAGIRVLVRFTLDLDNAASLRELAERMVMEFKGFDNVSMYSKSIYRETSREAWARNPERVSQTVAARNALDDFLLAAGVYDLERIFPASVRTHYCAANNPGMVVISPKGRLCSCECNCVPKYYWGDVSDKEVDVNRRNRWIESPEIHGPCTKCSLLPICTPFVARCPDPYYDCKTRITTPLERFISENVKRLATQLPPLPFAEDFSQFFGLLPHRGEKGGETR